MNDVVNLRELTLRNCIEGALQHVGEDLTPTGVKAIVDALVLAEPDTPASPIDEQLRTVTRRQNPEEPTFEIVEIDAGDFEAIVHRARGAEPGAVDEADIPEIAERGARGEKLTAIEQAAWSGYEIGWRDGHNDASAPAEPDQAEECIGCEIAFKPGDLVHIDVSGGSIHDACCDPGIDGFVDLKTGEPLKPGDARPEPTVWS